MTFSETIIPIPALRDNYIWLFFDKTTRDAWVVDPGDAGPVIAALKEHQLALAGILLTHHHADHSGGILQLRQQWTQCTVYGSEKSPLDCLTQRVNQHTILQCGPVTLQVLAIPGHTLDHVAYYNNQVLFCGDTLFSAGCGRIFEGTAPQMYHTLMQLAQLPEEIHLFCGHEYTLANLTFAQTVEPQNAAIAAKIQQVHALRAAQLPSLPAILREEKQYNPFLRCDQKTVIQAVENYCQRSLPSPLDVFTELRQWKNNFIALF